MPLYDYRCLKCGEYSRLRPVAERNDPCPCPSCGGQGQRLAVAAPGLATLTPAVRAAHDTNERARHEPLHSRHVHGTGCGCGRSNGKPAASKTFPLRRPWMISH